MNDPLRYSISLELIDLREKRKQNNFYTWENATLPSAEAEFLRLDESFAIIE